MKIVKVEVEDLHATPAAVHSFLKSTPTRGIVGWSDIWRAMATGADGA